MTERSSLAVGPSEGSKMEPEFELSEEQWQLIKDLFPESTVGPQGGRPMVASRPCVEGILWMLRSGARWKDIPLHFPSAATCWRRHRDWTRSGVWEKAWASELLPPVAEDPLLTDEHLGHYETALTAFLEGRWGDAYEQLHHIPPQDLGKDLLISFILQHNHTPPPDWDGVIAMQSKS